MILRRRWRMGLSFRSDCTTGRTERCLPPEFRRRWRYQDRWTCTCPRRRCCTRSYPIRSSWTIRIFRATSHTCMAGVEVEVSMKSYCTRLVPLEDNKDGVEKAARPENGGFLKPHIFTLTIPQIDGGSFLSVKLHWSQKLSYCDGEFSLNVPFKFPEYVTPAIRKTSKKEKILLNVNAGTGSEVLCKTTSHPLKQLRREAGQLGFSYESEVLKWSNTDFSFSYTVSPSHMIGGILLQSPPVHDVDQREMFCIYFYPGSQKSRKVFRKDVIFMVDISGSMLGKPLEDTKNALSAALSKLDPKDLFNIIAFNGETHLFSTSMELATKEAVERATQWIGVNFIAEGGTDILRPLTKAIDMLSNTHGSIPTIFLVTDGAVENERHICDMMKSHLTNGGSICPHIYTFGIGLYCNHYFLHLLAKISRGHYGVAYDLDSVELGLQKLFTKGLSTVLANITIDMSEDLDEFEMNPSCIPDCPYETPLTLCGRYRGNFPDNLKAKGLLGDLSDFVIELKTQHAKDIPLDKVFAKQQIDLLTAQAWLSEDKQLEGKVAKMSVQTGIISEYTSMIILETGDGKRTESPSIKMGSESTSGQKMVDSAVSKTISLQSLHIGFGDLIATTENIPPCKEETKLPEAAEIFVKAASNCCSSMCNKCCCLCCIQCCSKLNDRCVIVLTQICTALACFGCLECCSFICCSGSEG
ncbi:von Willebrand factor A domain-containing protein DDB_G0286969 isoform X3 [Mangifera indica]|uniref:von Willebrand factor A domain-containing protein DDB_G0286969 isoform X3 n=2 Tax=Mangifera indica TaxID=29780 RepID=UPI001CFAB739|nr:von Willebrand factor A domain-containing protein DDB_G0286969 isoform X3 [Mangifera indica]